MKKFDLQLFASAVPGKRIVYLFRRLSKQAEEGAWNLAFVTENGRTLSVDADSTATKDGSIRTPGVPEQEVTVTCVLSKGDTRVDGQRTLSWTVRSSRFGKPTWRKL
ncbi:MAG: phage major tail protein, TP901-1 family [Oscillospiraceae bacterium]